MGTDCRENRSEGGCSYGQRPRNSVSTVADKGFLMEAIMARRIYGDADAMVGICCVLRRSVTDGIMGLSRRTSPA